MIVSFGCSSSSSNRKIGYGWTKGQTEYMERKAELNIFSFILLKYMFSVYLYRIRFRNLCTHNANVSSKFHSNKKLSSASYSMTQSRCSGLLWHNLEHSMHSERNIFLQEILNCLLTIWWYARTHNGSVSSHNVSHSLPHIQRYNAESFVSYSSKLWWLLHINNNTIHEYSHNNLIR